MLKTSTYDINGVPVNMMLVEGGTFTMGSDGIQTALPAHQETIDHDYLMAETEVTEALWSAVMGQGGGSSTLPKTSVTWTDAKKFIEKLNQVAHANDVIPADANFYLPSEAEWEFAAIGGNASKGYTYAGGNDIDAIAETQENSGMSPVVVKGKQPNELGLYDMSGNAYEWVDGQEGSGYVKKGGSNYHSFNLEPYLYAPQGRYIYSSTDWTIGFRIALR